MKFYLKIPLWVLAIFLISVVVINIIRPAFQNDVGTDYQEWVSRTAFESDTVSRERILCIDANEEAMLWRLRMIAAAKESIVLATFDLRDDESGTDIMAALLDAADRGVSVKLLVDGIYQLLYLKDSAPFHALCAHENVEARYYNPVNLKNIYRVNYRMHDKYLMVDEQMYLLGGRNTTDVFLGKPQANANIDRDLLVYHTGEGKGESFGQLQSYFAQIWEEPCVTAVKIREQKVQEKEYTLLRERYSALQEEYGDFAGYQEWTKDTFSANRITLLHNGTQAGNKDSQVLYAIEQLAAKGKNVTIQSPYVICNREMYEALEHMEAEGEVKIFLNAVAKGTNPWGCTDYLNNKEKILATGADVYEVMNEHAVHTKAVLIDNHLSIVGSYNLDMRSTYLDTELMLVVDSTYLNSHIREMTEDYRKKSIEVLSDGTETVGELYQDKELSAGKKAYYGLLRVIIRPFRHML